MPPFHYHGARIGRVGLVTCDEALPAVFHAVSLSSIAVAAIICEPEI